MVMQLGQLVLLLAVPDLLTLPDHFLDGLGALLHLGSQVQAGSGNDLHSTQHTWVMPGHTAQHGGHDAMQGGQ